MPLFACRAPPEPHKLTHNQRNDTVYRDEAEPGTYHQAIREPGHEVFPARNLCESWTGDRKV